MEDPLRNRPLRFAAAALAVVLSSGAVQSSAQAIKAHAAVAEAARLDLSAAAIPEGFTPDDIVSVFHGFAGREGELNSGRADSGSARRIRSQYVFDVDTSGLLLTYEAEKQRFSGRITAVADCTFIQLAPDCSSRAIHVRHIARDQRQYFARNPHGATVSVKELYRDTYAVLVAGTTPPTIPVVFEVSSSDALRVKGDIGLLLFAAPPAFAGPLTANGIQRSKPTVHNPVSLVSNEYYLRLSVQAFWLYDRKTGRVYAKIPLSGDSAAGDRVSK
jgi:hypothetical protein